MTTITIDRATVEQALEALESVLCDPEGKCCIDGSDADRAVVDKALAALRAALAQQAEPVGKPEGEQPAGVVVGFTDEGRAIVDHDGLEEGWVLYTAPPQRKPLPKQDQHCVDVPGYGLVSVRLVRAIERAHGITDPQAADHLARHGIPMPEGDPK